MASGKLTIATVNPSVALNLPVFPEHDLPATGELGAIIYVLTGPNSGTLKTYKPVAGGSGNAWQ